MLLAKMAPLVDVEAFFYETVAVGCRQTDSL